MPEGAEWRGQRGSVMFITASIRNASGVSGCTCSSVNETWEDDNTSFMDFTALQ